ncbi:MAG: DedA family protein [Muribaculaceae bacterium]|nr:DedA family protein [Muribaculaceae bacterium]
MLPLALFDAAGFFGWFVENANYWLVFVFMMIESSFIPFPSEVVVPPAAYLAVQSGSNMSVVGVVLAATAGAVAGAFVNYLLALWIGRPLVYKFADSRFGHACLINREKVEHAEAYFDKHGGISTFLGRLIPAVRQLISIPAGLARMHIGKFIAFTALGAAVWNAVLAALGAWLGHKVPIDKLFPMVEEYNSYLTWIGLGILVVCCIVIGFNALKKQK